MDMSVLTFRQAYSSAGICLHSSYILKVPFNKDDTQGVAYVWIGNRADPDEAKLTEEIAEEMYGVCVVCLLFSPYCTLLLYACLDYTYLFPG